MKKTYFLPGNKVVEVIKSKQIICLDKTHFHKSPIQIMLALLIDNHPVEVTQDGDAFNVRIDESLTKLNLTVDQAVKFVKDNT